MLLLIILLLLRIEALGDIGAERRLDACEGGDTKHKDGEQKRKRDYERRDQRGGEELITLQNAALLQDGGVGRCEWGGDEFGRRELAGGDVRRGGGAGEDYEMLREYRRDRFEFAGEVGFCMGIHR